MRKALFVCIASILVVIVGCHSAQHEKRVVDQPFDRAKWLADDYHGKVRLSMGKAALEKAKEASTLARIIELLGSPSLVSALEKENQQRIETPKARFLVSYGLEVVDDGWEYGIVLLFDENHRCIKGALESH